MPEWTRAVGNGASPRGHLPGGRPNALAQTKEFSAIAGEGRNGQETLEARGVSVFFGGLRAVDQVDVRLQRAEILGLIGPNGAGKTTLMNVVTGLQGAASGNVIVSGEDVTGWPPHRRVRKGVARTFQDLRLFRKLTVLENAEAGALGVGMGRAEARSTTLGILGRFGLLGFEDVPAGSLNHVQQRLLSIARALTSEPKYLLLDEPGAGLSESESDEFLQLLVEIRDEVGCGLLVIEHDMRLIMRLCERIQVLNEGATIALGTPKEVQKDPLVIKAYLGA